MSSPPQTAAPSTSPQPSERSLGIRTYHPDPMDNATAEDMSNEMTDVLFQTVLKDSRPATGADAALLKERVGKLQEELQTAKGEIEFATLKEEELQSRIKQSLEVQEELKQQVLELNRELEDTRSRLERQSEEQTQLRQSRRDLEIAQAEVQQLKQQRPPGDGKFLEDENASLRAQVSVLENDLTGLQEELSHRQVSTTVPADGEPSGTFANASSEEAPLLGAAYQQISVLNTQLAHLYTELTLARTEAASLRAEKEQGQVGGGSADSAKAQAEAAAAAAQADSQRQAQQIADLVSDIRHLQLDLEYHQQKVDQLLEEKQLMMKDIKSSQHELSEARRELEEKDQLLKHQEVDLMHFRQQEQHSPRGASISASEDGMLDALRTEAAAKDSALIVSHYELHKEKLMRDRLEQKNLKLMERMQKLMMVVETMRKDNVTLERTLAAKDRVHEEKDAQLRVVTQKVRQLQKNPKAGRRGVSKGPPPMLELEGSMQNLPPLDSGRRSGRSTPRGVPGSPYTGGR